MYELLVTGMNWNDVIKMGSRSAGTTGTQYTDHGSTTGSPTRHAHRPPQIIVSSLFGYNQCTLGTTACVGGSGKIYHTQGDSNRLTGAYTSSKFNVSELHFGNFKIIRPLWFLG